MQVISQGRKLGLLVRTAPPFASPLCCRRRRTTGASAVMRFRVLTSMNPTWMRRGTNIDRTGPYGRSQQIAAVEAGYGAIEWHSLGLWILGLPLITFWKRAGLGKRFF